MKREQTPHSSVVPPEKKQKIAVVGAGPAGLACAVTAAGDDLMIGMLHHDLYLRTRTSSDPL